MLKNKGPKVLFMDIETAPIVAYVWNLFDQNVALNQIVQDWYILSFSAKWLGNKTVIYEEQQNIKPMNNDRALSQKLWKLLDEADVVVTQNGRKFDVKKANSRFAAYKMKPPSSFKQIDILELNKKVFSHTSNKLEYITNLINEKYKKLKHNKFPGMELWVECLKGNKQAWSEMKKYNAYDVLALEEAYNYIVTWDNSVNFNLYHDSTDIICKCGSTEFKKYGYAYTASGKFQRYQCKSCGSETRSKENLFSKEKKKSLRAGTVR